MRQRIRLATRGSALARAQAELAASALRAAGPAEIDIVVVRTTGDRRQDVAAADMPGQGWFTSELEATLLDGGADCAVHSAKDLPTTLAQGLRVAAHLPRGDVRDAVALREGVAGLEELPAGACVGTSSPRREALLHAALPELRVVPIRGNVDTRLHKLDAGEVDALLLAAAGLDRIGQGERASQRLDPRLFPPAPAQGAVALEVAAAGPPAVAAVDDAATSRAVRAERTVLAELGGGCRLALGAWAREEGGSLVLTAALAQGGQIHRAELAGPVDEPERLGVRVASALRHTAAG